MKVSVYAELEYCKLTKSPAKILRPFIDRTSGELYETYKTLNTGVDVQATSVYSICSGVVIQIGKDRSKNIEVTVQYSRDKVVRYAHLKSVAVESGSLIHDGDLIGEANKYVRVEYALTDTSCKKFPVRISYLTYYKFDPIGLVRGDVSLPSTGLTNVERPDLNELPITDISKSMMEEFSNNIGAKDVELALGFIR